MGVEEEGVRAGAVRQASADKPKSRARKNCKPGVAIGKGWGVCGEKQFLWRSSRPRLGR